MATESTPNPPERPAEADQPRDAFEEGEATREGAPEEEQVRRFSEGQDHLPPDESP
jgi:hypothetical protein